MLYLTRRHLKPGMILAKDVIMYSRDNLSMLLLAKGQVLNNIYIDKINYHNIEGVYIESEAFSDIDIEPYISDKLKTKSLKVIYDTYYEFQINSGKISAQLIKQMGSVVNSIVQELLYKDNLAYNLIDFKNYDSYTYLHCLNVAMLSISTGISLKLSEQQLNDLGLAGMLHDIGKMSIPIELLNKPDKLTKEEYEIIKSHPINAVNQLKNTVKPEILRAIEDHHEKLDGTGYPYGKKGNNISPYAKILTVCDVYDALTSDRPYRRSVFPNEVVEYMMGSTDTLYDYEVFEHFIKIIVAYPVGTFVKLSSEKLAVVVKNHPENLLRPLVRIINHDGTIGKDVDLLNDKDTMNITVVDMGYNYDNHGLTAI